MPKKSEKTASNEIKEPKKSSLENFENLQAKILENLVQLQKVHTDLAEKFDSLSKQISSLLSLFEMTARSFSQNPANQVLEKDKEFLDKIDKLLDQNKTIARGLTLMEEKLREKVYGAGGLRFPPMQSNEKRENNRYQESLKKPLPKF